MNGDPIIIIKIFTNFYFSKFNISKGMFIMKRLMDGIVFIDYRKD